MPIIKPDTISQAGTMGASCQTPSMHKLTCENGGISQRRPRALHEPSNTVVKHRCCEEALLLTFPDLGSGSTNELQQMVGTPCQLQANPGTPTNNHGKSAPQPPVLDLSRTLTEHKPHKVAHWALTASHKPVTNSAGVALGTKCQSQASHLPTGVTLCTKCQSQANHKLSGCHTGY